MTDPILSPELAKLRILRTAEVTALTGLTYRALYDLMRRAEFPHAFKVTSKALGWREVDVLSWLQSRKVAQFKPWTPKSAAGE
jgi:predicted DNA-binding transcriptional regulator AlpA